MEPLRDRLNRPLETLRVSITDRCNFRCVYCMPKEVFGREYRFLERRELLSFEEIARVAEVFVGLGVNKLRITGGEPLDLLEAEQLTALEKAVVAAEHLLRHAVDAAEVATVGHADPQVVERPAKGVERIGPHVKSMRPGT